MKKLMFLLILLPGLSMAAVTQQQAQQARAASIVLSRASDAMFQYSNQVNYLFESNFTLQVPGTTQTVTIPQSLQDQLIDIAKYNALKAALIAAYNQLP